jgi:hypothetical protein
MKLIIKTLGVVAISRRCMVLPGTTLTLQERAYTSPIWYTPSM